MMLGIREAITHTVTELTSAGLDATDDPRRLRVPGVIVQYVAADPDTLDGGATITLRALCVAADRDDPRTLDTLEALAAAVVAAVGAAGPITPRGVLTTTHAESGPLPGLEVPLPPLHYTAPPK